MFFDGFMPSKNIRKQHMNHHRIGKVFVWPLCTRIIHWIIALSFLSSFLTAFSHKYLLYHLAFGYIFAFVLTFRIIWGFIGPRYATFNTFKLHVKDLKFYFEEKMRNRWRKISPGHNPASSWFTLIVLFFGYSIVICGLFLYGVQEGQGLLRFLNPHYYHYSNMLFYLHRYLSFFLLFWAFVHICGVLIEQFYHRTSMVFAMITGYKKSEGEDTNVSIPLTLFSYSVIALSLALFYFILAHHDNVLTQSRFTAIDYEKESPIFADKCTKCHKNYPPYMLPQASWEKLLDGIDNHFGEEITENNITKVEQKSIKEYILSHSAENSSHKLSFKTLASLGEMRPVSITKSPYWREVHEGIDAAIFKQPNIKKKSNCFACHIGFDKGLFDVKLIVIPN